jgi:uncharacterized membrane protein
MKRVQHQNSKTLENENNGKFPVKRLLVPIIFAFIFIGSLTVFVTLLSDNAEATYGLSIWITPPSSLDMDTSTTPQSAYFTVNVKNEGTSEENVNLTVTFDLPQKETEGWKVTPKTFTVTSLGSGATDQITILVEAPFNIQNATAGSFAQLTVNGYVIEQPALVGSDGFTAKITQIYKTAIEVKGIDSKSVDLSDGTVSYDLYINNSGNGEDTFDFSANNLPVGWTASFSPAKQTVGMGGSSTTKMTLNFPSMVKSQNYGIGVVSTSQGDPSKSDETSTFTFINKKYQLSIGISPSPSQTGLPGDDVVFTMTVDNLGNTDDFVNAKFIKVGGLTWDVFLDQGPQLINYQSSATWTMTVTVHSDAMVWHKGNVLFNVTSTNPSGDAEVLTLTKVDKVYDVGVYIPQNTKVADPGDIVTYSVEITNRGNTNDTIRIRATGDFTADPSPNQLFDLLPDTPTIITLNVSVPMDALSGLHQITVTAESQGDPANINSTDVATVDVKPLYDVDLQSLGGEYKSGKPGGATVAYQLRVVNDGTDEDTIDLSRTGQKPNWAALSETTITIPAQSYTVVDITVGIPSGEPINIWYFNITGTSVGNSSKVDMQSFQIEVEQIFDVTLSSDKPSKSVPAGGSIIYYIDVKNSGSGLDDFTIEPWAIDSVARTWASVSSSNIKLNKGQNITIEMLIEVDESALPSTYAIQLNCTSVNDSTVKKLYMTHTQVTDKFEVLIAGAKERVLEAPEDVNVTYVLEVYNFGTGTDTFQISATGDQTGWITLSTSLITLAPSEQYNLTVTVNIKDAKNASMDDGKHNLKITITSKDDPSTPKSWDYVWLNTSLTETRDASLNPEQDVFNAEPKDIVYFTISLTNTGSTTDTFELEDDGSYKSWGTILNPTVTLTKDESINITYKVEVSETITRDKSPVELYLWAKSLGADLVVENITLQININQTFGVQIFSVQSEQTGDPGDYKVFQIEIKNEGNDVDDIVLSHSGTELGVWNMSVARLQPDQSIFAEYNVSIASDHDINDILITLNATSGDTDVYMTLPIIIHVNPKYEVRLVANGPSTKNIKGGENKTFSLGITNRGTDVDVFDLIATGAQKSWAVINPSDPTNTTVWVQASQTVYITIQVSVPEGEDVKLYDIIINVTSQNDKSVTEEYTFSANVEATYDVFIYPGNPHDKVKAGFVAEYVIFVENKGNDDDQFNFFDTGLPAGWDITISPSSLNVQAGSTESVDITVTTSSGSASGLYEFNITATSINDATKESSTVLITEVEQRYNILLSSATSTQSVDVGNYVIYSVEVKNDGNGPDVFEVKISGTYSHWATLYYNATEQGDIIHISPPPGGSLSVQLNVSIPNRAEWEINSPASVTITVEAESIQDPDTPPAKTKDFITNINNIYEVIITTTSDSRAGVPTDTVSFTVNVKNDGTVSDSFNLEIEQFYTMIPGISIGVWDDENPNPFSSSSVGPISSGVSQSVTMDITIPSPEDLSEVPTGNYYIVIKVTSQGKSTVFTNKTFTVKVQQLYSAWITDSMSAKSTDVGSYVEYQLKVQNKGNKLDTITFEIEDDIDIPTSAGWGKIYYQGSVITSLVLNASESKFVIFNVSIPDRGLLPSPEPTSVDLMVKVKPSGAVPPGIEDEIQITTNIKPIYTFDLTSMSPNDKKEADAGELISFTLQVQNTGTVIDSYTLRVSNFDESKFSIQSINSINNLGPDGYGTTTVSITIDPDTDLGSYLIEITVESVNEPSVKHGINLTVDIIGPVYIFNYDSPSSIKDGEPGTIVEYTLQIRNAGTTTDSYEFRVTNVDDTIFTIPQINTILNLDEDSYGTTIVSVTITNAMNKAVAGTYKIEVTANSEADPAVTKVLNLTLKITPTAEVEITPGSQQDQGEPGDVVDYFVKIINKGNAEDTFDLTLSAGNKEWGQIYTRDGSQLISSVTLNESEATHGIYFIEVILRVTIPSTGETQAGTSYPITIKATSRNTEGVEETAQVSTKVEDFVDLELEYSGSGEPARDYDPNKKAPKFSFRATNNGNEPEDSIEIRVDTDWEYTPKLMVDSLEPGGAATFALEFDIPSDENVGEYNLEVYLISGVDITVRSEGVFITVNFTKPDLSVSDVEGTNDLDYLRGRVGNAATITATIDNSGTTEARNVQVKLYEYSTVRGTKSISAIPAGGSKDVDFRWTVVAEEVELKVEVIPLEEIDDGNNEYPTIFLDLKPELSFVGEQINFSKTNPAPGDKITLTAFVRNDGGEAENVVIKFYDGSKIIGTDEIDIEFGDDEIGEASVEWTVPDKDGESISIKAEIDHSGSGGHKDETTKSITVGDQGGVDDLFSISGIIMLVIGFIIGAILFLFIGRASGRGSGPAPAGPSGMTGPTFGAFEKEMGEGADKKAMKGPAGAAPAPFERMDEEGGGEGEEEEGAKPKEAARVRCPKCGRVMEVTSTQRPLQIPCECGTTLMLKK